MKRATSKRQTRIGKNSKVNVDVKIVWSCRIEFGKRETKSLCLVQRQTLQPQHRQVLRLFSVLDNFVDRFAARRVITPIAQQELFKAENPHNRVHQNIIWPYKTTLVGEREAAQRPVR